LLARPEVGSQARFKKKKPKATYRYDSSLAPEMNWDGQNPAREHGEWLIGCIEEAAKLADVKPPFTFPKPREFRSADGRIVATVKSLADATEQLKRLSGPFLNWSGKAERLSFDVPTLPLFVHERLSTQAIVETLKSHRKDAEQTNMFDLFGDPQRPLADAITRAYEHQDKWVNRLILGDSLVVMNSLLKYEGMGGQVQMIYIDPPYGIEYNSNFQPFLRKTTVSSNADEDMTREPEMVSAYRDTWSLAGHSYLSYVRDRLLTSRDLLNDTGSIFMQISTENLEKITILMNEVFGPENKIEIISFRKKTMPLGGRLLEGNCDYLVWYSKDKERVKYHPIFLKSDIEGDTHWNYVELADGTRREMTRSEIDNHALRPEGADPYQLIGMYPTGIFQTGIYDFEYQGDIYKLPPGKCWKTPIDGMRKLAEAKRLQPYDGGSTLRYILKHSDYPVSPLNNVWQDTSAPSDKRYVVQTSNLVLQRCVLMTTDPGDLVIDPTCGSGTTALVSEQWGRRWITIDTSRVPLALARQRILTSNFAYYRLRDNSRGPSGGFVYARHKNRKGNEDGGVVPHVTLRSIANGEGPEEEILFDRPDEESKILRVAGPFCVEATIDE